MSSTRKFGWFVGSALATLPYLSGIELGEFYLNPETCARSFRVGRRRLKELFGDDITLPVISCAPLSYGHLACLGAKIIIPRSSEPVVRPAYATIDEAIGNLERGTRFEENELFNHYLRTQEYLKREFPDEDVKFSGFGWEGPITSAVLLRGLGFFTDLHRQPSKTRRYLELLTDSIVEFIHLTRRINKEPLVNPDGTGLVDDLSSHINHKLWPEFVVPYWDRLYLKTTSGRRTVHCENLSPDHLKFLEEVGIVHFDPSVSAKLSPKIIKEKTTVPFTWRLPSFRLLDMSSDGVREWVKQVTEEGATHVHLYIEEVMCEGENPNKVHAFIQQSKAIASNV